MESLILLLLAKKKKMEDPGDYQKAMAAKWQDIKTNDPVEHERLEAKAKAHNETPLTELNQSQFTSGTKIHTKAVCHELEILGNCFLMLIPAFFRFSP